MRELESRGMPYASKQILVEASHDAKKLLYAENVKPTVLTAR